MIVIIGENRSFDHVFATYQPKQGESVWNLLSEGIVNADGTPGPNFSKAQQLAATDSTPDAFLLNPPKSQFPGNILPLPLAGGPTTPYVSSTAAAEVVEDGLATDYYQYLATGGTGLATVSYTHLDVYKRQHPTLRAQNIPNNPCPRPAIGSVVPEPEDLRSQNGVLKVDLTVRDYAEASGTIRYCYVYGDGSQSPTLRLSPGDLLILHLKNELTGTANPAANADHSHSHTKPVKNSDPCNSASMTLTSTNLHFHGLTVPPVCHQDEVLKTSIQPSDPPFEYRFRIPENEPPGLYWYHPHIHGFSKAQVLGGASGALIVEGIRCV